ncbi:MAG: MerR family transcriptional regulator [Desulfotomaculum sp.]|nr:MerR family transcriptional regulator [Desulfotomaculum sp.]
MALVNDDLPLYNIGVVAELLKVHPETLRIWEKHNLIFPARRNKQRLYSNNDVKRLQFIHYLINEKGLNIAGVQQMISLYPCWKIKNCPGGKREQEGVVNKNKPCWKEQGTYCYVIEDKADYCSTCGLCQGDNRKAE